MRTYIKGHLAAFALAGLAVCAGVLAEDKKMPAPAKAAAGPPTIAAAKLIVDDLKKAQDFYEQVFGVKEVKHYSVAKAYDESILSFGDGAGLALFQPLDEPALKKSRAPVVAIYSSDFDAVLKRVNEMGFGFRELKASPGTRIIIAQDPSGNAVEIISR